MNVIYKQTMVDKILEVKHEADALGLSVEKIVLTKEEYDRLIKDMAVKGFSRLTPLLPRVFMLYGIKIEKEED